MGCVSYRSPGEARGNPRGGPRGERQGGCEYQAGGKLKDLFSVEGKTALVTGGSRGIGLMIARGFVERGVRVYISSRKQEVCDEVAVELSKLGTCISLPADLASEAECVRLAAEVAGREPALDILVNNAGANWGAQFEEFPAEAWDKVLGLNLKSVFLLTRAFTPLLEKAATAEDPARVINIGSIDGIVVPSLDTWAYSASKAAVLTLKFFCLKMLDRNCK